MHITEIGKRCVTLEIGNPGILRTLTYLKPNTYSEPSQRFKMECFPKIIKSYRVILRYALYEMHSETGHIQDPVHYCRLRHIQAYSCSILPYCGLFRTLCNSCIFTTLPH